MQQIGIQLLMVRSNSLAFSGGKIYTGGWCASIGGQFYNGVAAFNIEETLWNGNVSHDWNNPQNWSQGKADRFNTARIPAGIVNQPHITSPPASFSTVNNLIIDAGASLTIDAGKALTVNGTITNNAGFSGLGLKSDIDGTASLICYTTGVDANVDKYLTKMKWHFIGAPVENEAAGVFHLPSGHSDIYLKTHIESSNTWGPFIVPQNAPLIQGRGYECWLGNAGFNQDETIKFNGKLNAGSYTTGTGIFYTLEYTPGHGLNLISNPYASALQADIQTWAKSNMANSVWTWDPASGNYVFWNGTNGTNGNGYGTLTGGIIPSMQAFFVLATDANPSLSIPQSSRLHSDQPYYKNSEIPVNTLRLDVSGNDYRDAVFVNFSSNSGAGYEMDSDVQKIFGLNESPQLYVSIPGQDLSISSLPFPIENTVVNIGFKCGTPIMATLKASGMEGFEEGSQFYLMDIKEGITNDLNQNPEYTFNSEPDYDPNRFVLYFTNPNGIEDLKTNPFTIQTYNREVVLVNTSGEPITVYLYDVMGRQLAMERLNGNGSCRMQSNAGSGYYIVKILNSKKMYSQKVFIK